MDLLDLELDLNVAPPTRKSARVTAPTAPTSSTPKLTEKPAETGSETPKSTRKAVPRIVDEMKDESETSGSTTTSRLSSVDRDSRSASIDKRSRNKAKKRFSPSPVTPASKKRKTALKAATPVTPTASKPATPVSKPVRPSSASSSAKPAKKPEPLPATPAAVETKMTRICSGHEFAQGLAELREKYKKRGPSDYELPDDIKSPAGAEPSEKVNEIIRAVEARQSQEQAGGATENVAEPEKAKEESKVHKEPKKARGKSVKISSTPKSTPTSKKAASDSEDVDVDAKLVSPRRTSSRFHEETSSSGKKTRKSKNNSEVGADDQIALNPNSALAIRQRLMAAGGGNRKTKKAKNVGEPEEPAEEPDDVPGPAPPPVKTVRSPVKSPAKPKSAAGTPSAPPPPPPAAVKVGGPTPRSSGRVSKPNRLYADQSFNTEILGRKTVTEQNEVLEEFQAIAREITPDPEPVAPSTSSSASRPSTAPKKKSAPREYIPKPVSLLNGVIRGYVASVKVPLEDIEVDGVVEKLNDTVTELMDRILLEVCADGVQQHENIDPAVVKAKRLAKIDRTKKLKKEARLLDIQMRFPTSSSTAPEETGRRKRHAPKTDDMYWTPAEKWIRANGAKGERKVGGADVVAQPDEVLNEYGEPEELTRREEKRQQAARHSIANYLDTEMEQSIKEAKNFTLHFDKFINPRIAKAKQRANIKLMSTKRKSSVSEDFYYHELLAEHQQSISPTNSNVENEEIVVDLDEPSIQGEQIQGINEPVSEEVAISIRTDALDMAEQIAVHIRRPTRHDGSEVPLDDLLTRTVEQTDARKASLAITMEIVVEQLAHESAPRSGEDEEIECAWHTMTQMNAQRLKDAFTISSSDREDAVVWTHQFLVESLPVHVLASYLSLLRYAKRIFDFQNPSRFAYIISYTTDIDDEWTEATRLLKSFVNKRIVEPGAEVLNQTVPYRRMTDTVFLLVSPAMTSGGRQWSGALPLQTTTCTHHAHLFRWLHLIGHPDSEMIGFSEEEDCTVAEYLSDIIIDSICNKVREKRRQLPNSKIVLVGYGASTYLAHRAVNLVKGISAVISIGFPVMSKFGRRGTADDEILLTYCPTLFIVGSEGRRFNNEAMTELRASMMTRSGLVVVGHANDNLLVPSAVLLRLGITQKVVHRMVLEKILDFLNLDKVKEQNLADLKPLELNNVYDLDSSLLKSEKALSGLAFANPANPAPLGASARRATVSGADESGPQRKRKNDPPAAPPTLSSSSVAPTAAAPSQPSPSMSSMFPSRIPMPPPSSSAQEHFHSFQSLMAQTVSTGLDDMPQRRASMGASPRVIERGDFRALAAHRPAPSGPRPQPPQPPPTVSTQPKGPIDPASISLN